MRKKNGFIAISVIYSFFAVFLVLLLIIVSSYIENRTSFDFYKTSIKEKNYKKFGTNVRYFTDMIITLADTTKNDGLAKVVPEPYSSSCLVSSTSTSRYSSCKAFRFEGATANNYVCFGSEDCSGTKRDNLWRIVGVFHSDIHKVTTGRTPAVKGLSSGSKWLVKIVKAEGLDLAYDNSEYFSSNIDSTLNGTFLDSIGSDESHTAYYNMIQEATWNYSKSMTTTSNVTTAYTNERSGTGSMRRIGLLYPSDWAYTAISDIKAGTCSESDSYSLNNICTTNPICNLRNSISLNKFMGNTVDDQKCKERSWLQNNNQWLLGATSGNEHLYIDDGFNLASMSSNTEVKKVYPALYLTDNVVVIRGDGSMFNPYVIATTEGV